MLPASGRHDAAGQYRRVFTAFLFVVIIAPPRAVSMFFGSFWLIVDGSWFVIMVATSSCEFDIATTEGALDVGLG